MTTFPIVDPDSDAIDAVLDREDASELERYDNATRRLMALVEIVRTASSKKSQAGNDLAILAMRSLTDILTREAAGRPHA